MNTTPTVINKSIFKIMKVLMTFLIIISALLACSVLDDVSDSRVLNRLDSLCKSHNLNPENFQSEGEKKINRGLLLTEHFYTFISKKDSVKIEIVAYSGFRSGEIHHMVETLDGVRI